MIDLTPDSRWHLLFIAFSIAVVIILADVFPWRRAAEAGQAEPVGWKAHSYREEIRPVMTYEPAGGKDGHPGLLIRADQREGLHGIWRKTCRVKGGLYYHFQAWRKAEGVACPRRSVLATITWQDERGCQVHRDEPSHTTFLPGTIPLAEMEYPPDVQTDGQGWTLISGIYRAPLKAEQALIELHLRWAANGQAVFSDVSLAPCAPPPSRKVRIAAIHLFPEGGKTAEENCRMFAPALEEAGRRRADLVVLPEAVNFAGRNPVIKVAEAAEPIPGPSSDFFAGFAKKHSYYIVVSLMERSGHLVYNTAALLGPEGTLIGKYRKVTLPRKEWDEGVAPGHEYPVFSTRFGKLGMMICYDGYFPEVARQLANRGAEIIAWPVWGCIPDLARARAIENHVYLASSTYTENWMITGVFNHAGQILAQTDKPGTLAIAEVDLAQPTYWPILGDFRSEYDRHRPEWGQER